MKARVPTALLHQETGHGIMSLTLNFAAQAVLPGVSVVYPRSMSTAGQPVVLFRGTELTQQ